MNVGDLVRLNGTNSRGIVLRLYPRSKMDVLVYWFDYKHYASHSAYDLEVIGERR